MAQKRRNIEDIASVLVRKLNELEKNIGQLENVEFEAPKVDYREFYRIINQAKEASSQKWEKIPTIEYKTLFFSRLKLSCILFNFSPQFI